MSNVPDLSPYAPPTQPVDPPPAMEDRLEPLRRNNLKVEGNIKAIAAMAVLGSLGYFGLVASETILLAIHRLDPTVGGPHIVMMAIAGCLALGSGLQLFRLKAMGRILYAGQFVVSVAAMVWSYASAAMNGQHEDSPTIWRLAIPLAIGAYLFGPKTKTIFLPDYLERIVPGTPKLKSRVALWFWLILGFLVLLVAGVIVGALEARRPPP